MWILRRIKILKVEPYILLDVCTKEIRSVLELAVPAWHSALTQKQTASVEKVQIIVVSIIMSDCPLNLIRKGGGDKYARSNNYFSGTECHIYLKPSCLFKFVRCLEVYKKN